MKILIKNIKTSEHYKIKVGFKAKVGDKIQRISEHKYIYNGEFEDCVVVKIFDKPKKKKPIYTENPELIKSIKDNYQKNMEKWQLQELRNRPYFKIIVTKVKGKPRGKENLTKIKFPCYCNYTNYDDKRYKGEIHRRYGWYMLFNIDKQLPLPKSNAIGDDNKLKRLIDKYNIEILKGELKLWREVR